MMVLYNSMTDEAAKFLVGMNDGHQILISLLNSLCHELVDWGYVHKISIFLLSKLLYYIIEIIINAG